MGARSRHVLLVALAMLFSGVVLSGPAAVAESTGNPVVDQTVATKQHFLGFKGPFLVDFSNAPYGTYSFSVSTAPSGEDPGDIVSGPTAFDWEAGKAATQSFAVPALSGGTYTFSIEDLSEHSGAVAFTVRPRHQPYCSLGVPSAVRVNAPEEVVVGRLASNCSAAQVRYASWDVRRAGSSFFNWFVFDKTSLDSWKHTASDPLGTFAAVQVDATNPFGDEILQNSPSTTIRLDSRVSLTSSRVRKYVTLRASLTRYVPTARAFRPWKARVVTLSYKTCKSCTWHRLTARTTTSKGKISVRVRAPKARYYRATVGGTSTIWAPYADQVRR